MPALLVLNYDVHDHDALHQYRQNASEIILGSSGRVLTSTTNCISLGEGGRRAGTHTVIVWYPSTDEARRCYESEAYQSLLPDRLNATSPKAGFVTEISASGLSF